MNANTSIQTRNRIIALHEDGYNISKISRMMNLTRQTVRRWIKNYDSEGRLEDLSRPGGKRKINALQREQIVQHYEGNSSSRVKTIAEHFNVTPKTIRNLLRNEGFQFRRNNSLAAEPKQQRLEFARQYLNFEWQDVIFSSKKSFRFSKVDKQIASTANMWGWMSSAGPGEMVALPPRATAQDYLTILDDVLLPSVRSIYPEEDFPKLTFVDDNSPLNRAQIVKEWYAEHFEVIKISWPAESKDLNPMEQVWAKMERMWNLESERSPNLLEEHWERLRGGDLCSNLVSSMPRKLQAVIKAKGGYPKNGMFV